MLIVGAGTPSDGSTFRGAWPKDSKAGGRSRPRKRAAGYTPPLPDSQNLAGLVLEVEGNFRPLLVGLLPCFLIFFLHLLFHSHFVVIARTCVSGLLMARHRCWSRQCGTVPWTRCGWESGGICEHPVLAILHKTHDEESNPITTIRQRDNR